MEQRMVLAFKIVVIVAFCNTVVLGADEERSEGGTPVAGVDRLREYDALCEDLVQVAQQCAQAFNKGMAEAAMKLKRDAKKLFEEAIQIDDENPQAYLNMAVFASNTHDFEEAMSFYDLALKRLQDAEEEILQQVLDSQAHAQFRWLGIRREDVYLEGKGNVSLAYEIGNEQLAIAVGKDTCEVEHQLGVLAVMLCEEKEWMCSAARQHFEMAQNCSVAVFRKMITGVNRVPMSTRDACRNTTTGVVLAGEWSNNDPPSAFGDDPTIVAITLAEKHGGSQESSVAEGNHVPRTSTMSIHRITQAKKEGESSPPLVRELFFLGKDAIMFIPSLCGVYSVMPDAITNVADNLLAAPPVPDPRQQHQEGVNEDYIFPLIQFSGLAFYHWIAEALPRLVVLQKKLLRGHHHLQHENGAGGENKKRSPTFRLIVPCGRSGKPTSFINTSIHLLFPELPSSKIQCYDTRRDSSLFLSRDLEKLRFVSWGSIECPRREAVLELSQDSTVIENDTQKYCVSLAHPVALKWTRDALSDARISDEATNSQPGGKKTIVFVSRGKHISMRNFDEDSLVSSLREAIASRLNGEYNLLIFDGKKQSLDQALEVFKGASLVVGAHGGGLANVIACVEGTHLVEIGFRTIGAQQYKHMAESLGMVYQRVLVDSNEGRSIGAATISFDESQVVNTVVGALTKQKQGDAVRDEL